MPNMLNVALAIAAAAWSPTASFAARTDDGDPVPRTSIAADGTSFTVWSDGDRLVVSAGDRHGFSRPVRIAGKTYGYAAAAAPGGRAAVAYSAGDGVHVKLRGGRDRLVIRSREVTNSLALAADPRGGWVLAAQRRRHVLAATLESGGRPMAPPQDLGAGDFGADARPTQALAVTGDGTAQFAFNRRVERSLASFSVIATRPAADGGALALWTTSRSWGAALAGPDGRFTRTAAPLGPPPHPGHFNSTNRDAAASGRYAIVAWGSGSNVRISMRQT
jgi:hypothetical protein